jgi:ankyrin repeat protein
LEKPAIFNLIENYQDNKKELIKELEIYNKFVFNLYFNKFNILTYSSLFLNGSLECIISFFNDHDLSFYFDLNGYNALHTSCLNGLIYNTKFLLENNFCSNRLSRNLKTPIILAIESNKTNNLELVRLLKHYGANLNFSITTLKNSPIELALNLKNKSIVNFLIKNNVYISDNIKQKLIKESNYYAQNLIKKNKNKQERFELLKEFYKESVLSRDKETINFFYSKLLQFKLL